jgi:pantetheine-phosphate adenylyltransferase, bacterial
VAVAVNPGKRGCFDIQARVRMLQRVTADLPNVRVESFEGLLVDYAARSQTQVIVRGLRAANDFEYEFQMAQLNRQLAPQVETLFMMTAPQHAYVSSSMVREVAALRGDIRTLVPEALVEDIYRACAGYAGNKR